MKKPLKRKKIDSLYHLENGDQKEGFPPDLIGDCTGLIGDCTGLWGERSSRNFFLG